MPFVACKRLYVSVLENNFQDMKLFLWKFVYGYEQQKLVKKNKKRNFLAEIGIFFVILQPEKL